MKYCIQCAAEMADTNKFCPLCGTPADGFQPAVSAQSGHPVQAAPNFEVQPEDAYRQSATEQSGSYYPGPAAPPGPSPYGNQGPAMGAPAHSRPSYTPENPYAHFPDNSNTKKSGGNGLLVGGIIGLFVLAIIIAAAVLLFGNPPASYSAEQAAASPPVTPPPTVLPSPQQSRNDAILTGTGDIRTDAALPEIAGYWTGELSFSRVEGYDTLPPEDLPTDYSSMISELLSSPLPMELYIGDEGHWEVYIDVLTGMMFGSYEYDYTQYETSPMLIELFNGAFDVQYSEDFVDDYGDSYYTSVMLSGVVREDRGELNISGAFRMEYREGEMRVLQEGSYVVTSHE